MVSVDGPCADAYEQATGGAAITEAEVIALLELADPTEPLVQALDAIECIVGLHSKSVGGGADGLCQVECL